MLVPMGRPNLDEAEADAVSRVLRSGWISTGPECQAFEAELAELVGAPRAVAVSSGTDALQIGLMATGAIGDVMLPTISFVSAIHATHRAGLRAVLVDCDPDTGLIDIDALAVAMTPTADTVLPCHLNGTPADMTNIDALAASLDLEVLEDAAHALPASTGGRTVGDPRGARRLTAFSFQASKTVTCADGGALTGPDDLLDMALRHRLHGFSSEVDRRGERPWDVDIVCAGLKANLTDVHAAIGRVQLTKASDAWARRRAVAAYYDETLAGVGVRPVPVPDGRVSARYAYAFHVEPRRRDALREQFVGHGVTVDHYFTPIHRLGLFRGVYPGPFPGADSYWRTTIALPCFAAITDAEVEHVAEACRRLLG